MNSFLIDLNVWLALTWEGHTHSLTANVWFKAVPKTRVRLLFCRITQLGLIRLLTNQAVMGESVVDRGTALGAYDSWLDDPRVEFLSEPPGMETAFRHSLGRVETKAANKAVMDAYLIALAKTESATLLTLDKALAAAAKADRVACVLLNTM